MRVGRYDYRYRWNAYSMALNVEPENFLVTIAELYSKEFMSCQEIAELLVARRPELSVSPRSILRWLLRAGVTPRTTATSFRLAAKKGRVQWAYKDPRYSVKQKQLPQKLRSEVLLRDNYRCVRCGAPAITSTLEVDHIIAKCNNGPTIKSNLRTLCSACSRGKALVEKEICRHYTNNPSNAHHATTESDHVPRDPHAEAKSA